MMNAKTTHLAKRHRRCVSIGYTHVWFIKIGKTEKKFRAK